jgi:hypothetical protein
MRVLVGVGVPLALHVLVSVSVPLALRVLVSVRVLLAVHVLMSVRVLVGPTGTAAVISPGLWRKRLEHVSEGGAQPSQHVLDNRVLADQNAPRLQLRRQMPVANMPGESDERRCVLGGDFDELLRGSLNTNEAPILEAQSVAGTQDYSPWQIQQESGAACGNITHAPSVPLVIVQHEAIGRCFPGPFARRQDFDSAYQG